MKAQGRIADAVYVDEVGPANRLYSKGHTGVPQPGNALKLSFVEAAFAQEEGRLVTGRSLAELLTLAGPDAEVQYLVYRDLRERGLVTRHNGTGFDVWKRAETPKHEKWFRCFPHGERTPLDPTNLQEGVYSVADNDGVVTHYWTSKIEPKGTVPPGDIPPLTGTALEDRVLVDGVVPEHMGTLAGDHTILSLTEAQSLVVRGVLKLDKDIQAPRLDVYTDLRTGGVVTKSGFRFGTHFRGYADNPDKIHAQWLIECPEGELDWSHISRGVRLAHGVKKEFVIAAGGYWHMDWFKP
jgi:tRNA-intron endonuclease